VRGIEVSPEKIAAIVNMKPPNNKKTGAKANWQASSTK
jgi:hypothetical protein